MKKEEVDDEEARKHEKEKKPGNRDREEGKREGRREKEMTPE